MEKKDQYRGFWLADYARLGDLEETLIFSQLMYWHSAEKCKWHFWREEQAWIKIDQNSMLEALPFFTCRTLRSKLKSLKFKGAIEIEQHNRINIYLPNGEELIMNREYLNWIPEKISGQSGKVCRPYIYIIYNLYIYNVADSIFIDHGKVNYEQIREFYYKLAKTIINVKCGSKAIAIQRLKRLSNRQLDEILEAIALLAMGKWFSFNDGFKQKFKQFEAWLSTYLKTDKDFLEQENSEIITMLEGKKFSRTAFDFWDNKLNFSKELIYAHQKDCRNSAQPAINSSGTQKRSEELSIEDCYT